MYIFCKKSAKKSPDIFLLLEILIYSFEKSIMTGILKEKFMKKNALKLKKASLSRNELRTLTGGRLPEDPIDGGAECGCLQAGCPGDGSARCGGRGCC
ncbi:hypothetical protein [Chryseobacterium sp. HR92]|uniref:hypothetical protein n=1 Tax=Chryseobacterium sp. HR92 TaxID=3094839 RepID=UPI00388FD716|nr:hypothetical protein SFA27_18810 [Chryseobacterium sp. HR92]